MDMVVTAMTGDASQIHMVMEIANSASAMLSRKTSKPYSQGRGPLELREPVYVLTMVDTSSVAKAAKPNTVESARSRIFSDAAQVRICQSIITMTASSGTAANCKETTAELFSINERHR